MLRKEDFESVGTLGRTHGIQGEITAKLSVDLSGLGEEAEEALFLMLEEQGLLIPYRVLKLRSKSADIDLITFAGITTKEEAERLVGRTVWLDKGYIDSEQAEELFGFEHYIGYQLHQADSREPLGVIEAVDDTTINTLLSVLTPQGQEYVLPISEELIDEVDLTAHRLYLHIPAGLLELD